MRNEAMAETPDLFSPEVMAAETTVGNHAREFVGWCCSLGDNFRNSPDATNFQYWLRQTKIKTTKAEEGEILAEARRLFMRKVEQHVRKAATAAAGPSQ
ncbi:MAG TPA: hypothetical protein VK210_03445 [Terriglobia bacterium]|nr:hypothetical protein [Terriglobia bacterium]